MHKIDIKCIANMLISKVFITNKEYSSRITKMIEIYIKSFVIYFY